MADFSSFTLKLGNWMDDMYGHELPVVAHVSFGGEAEPKWGDLVQEVNKWSMTSWQYEQNYRAFFANASSDVLAIAVTAYPVIADALWTGSLEAIARYLTSKLLDVFKNQWGTDAQTLEGADEMARYMLVNQAGLAVPDITRRLGVQDEDGTWLFIYHDRRRKADHCVRVGKQGVTAHVDMKHLDDVLERVRTFDYSQPPPDGQPTASELYGEG